MGCFTEKLASLKTNKFPLVVTVILNHNQYELTAECLKSLKKISYPNYRIILIDNNSNDRSIERLREEFPDVLFVVSKTNLGCASGRNLGVRKAVEMGAKYVLTIDNDTVVAENFLDELVGTMEKDNNVAAVHPLVYYFDKEWGIQSTGHVYNPYLGRSYTPYHRLRDVNLTKNEERDWLGGGAQLTKVEAFKTVGLFDDDLTPWSNEDMDWGIRARKKGYKLLFVPSAKIWHKKKPTNICNEFFCYHIYRGKAIFWRKQVKLVYKLSALAFLIYQLSRTSLKYAKRGYWECVGALWKGFLRGLFQELHPVKYLDVPSFEDKCAAIIVKEGAISI